MTTTISYPAPIQFRNDILERWISAYASLWQVSDNEAAKRLAALAAAHLDVDHYHKLFSLAQALSGPFAAKPDFVRACEHVQVAMEAANRTRQELGKKPLVHDEKTTFIDKTIDVLSRKTRCSETASSNVMSTQIG